MKNRLRARRVRAGDRRCRALPARRQVRAYKISKRFDCDISALCAGLVDRAGRRHGRGRCAWPSAAWRRSSSARRRPRPRCSARPGRKRQRDAAQAALAEDFTPLSDMRASAGLPAAGGAEPAAALLARDAHERSAAVQRHQRVRQHDAAARRPEMNKPHRHLPALLKRRPCARRAGRHQPAARVGAPARGRRGRLHRRPARAGRHAALRAGPVAGGARHARWASTLDGLRALPGVVAVLTAADIPGPNDCGSIVHDDPILAEGELRYLGQPVFAVIATTRDAARRAAAQAKDVLQIEPLPPVLTPQDAHAQGPVRAAADAPARAATHAQAPSPRRRTGSRARSTSAARSSSTSRARSATRSRRRTTACWCTARRSTPARCSTWWRMR